MSFQLPNKIHVTEDVGPRWSGAAVLVESMLLLVFLTASLAVFVQMFSAALERADESAQLTAAVAAASDTAEQFAAYPTQANGQHMVDDLLVTCNVKREPHESGTLYKAEISVYAMGDADAGSGAGSGSGAGAGADADANADANAAGGASDEGSGESAGASSASSASGASGASGSSGSSGASSASGGLGEPVYSIKTSRFVSEVM